MNLRTDLNRINAHLLGEDFSREVASLKNALKEEKIPVEGARLCGKLVEFFLFYKRDKKTALTYIEQFLSFACIGTAEFAKAQNWIGYASTIDGGYTDRTPFETALTTLSLLDITPDNQLHQAFALRYIALMYHRQKNPDKALEFIQQAIKIQHSLLPHPTAHFDIIESLHILGVILMSAERFPDAYMQLQESARFSAELIAQTDLPYFMYFTTQQSLARIATRLGKMDEALNRLQIALTGQIKLFGTSDHADIAKTNHFIGDAYLALGNRTKALEAYRRSLDIKKKLFPENSFMAQVTQGEITKIESSLGPHFVFYPRKILKEEEKKTTVAPAMKC